MWTLKTAVIRHNHMNVIDICDVVKNDFSTLDMDRPINHIIKECKGILKQHGYLEDDSVIGDEFYMTGLFNSFDAYMCVAHENWLLEFIEWKP